MIAEIVVTTPIAVFALFFLYYLSEYRTVQKQAANLVKLIQILDGCDRVITGMNRGTLEINASNMTALHACISKYDFEIPGFDLEPFQSPEVLSAMKKMMGRA
jgi:hypothetical protein